MEVAELVPAVAVAEGVLVAALEQGQAADGFEQCQVRRLGLVPARQDAVDDPDAAVWA